MLRAAEERLHLPREVSTFVLTVGASANQNGTALYEGVTVLFLAQLFAVDLTLGQQLMLLFFAILAGVGTAGVPSGSICFVVLILQSIHVPPEGIAVILGVDRLLDMCRTVPNVTGDLVLATVVVRSEGADILRKEPPPPTGVAPSGPGSAALTPPSPWPLADGRTSLEMTPMALLRRLAGMVPPFRSHAIHHFGGFAAHASLRSRIVPRSPMAERCPRGAVSSVHLPAALDTGLARQAERQFETLNGGLPDVRRASCPAKTPAAEDSGDTMSSCRDSTQSSMWSSRSSSRIRTTETFCCPC